MFIFAGKQQQCENAVSLIEKTNNSNKPPVESESDSSNPLIIDERTEERDDDNNNSEESEDEIFTHAPISQQPIDATDTSDKPGTLPIATSTSGSSSSSSLPATTCSSSITGEKYLRLAFPL